VAVRRQLAGVFHRGGVVSARPRLTAVAATATLLATLSLASVFREGDWFWPVVFCIAAGAIGCALGRAVGLPRPLVPVLGLAAVVLLVTWINARDVAVFGLLPGRAALRELNDLASSGFSGIRKYATPAPTDNGLVLLAAAGAGAVAVVVDTLAVGYRSAALAGVPLLVLYAVPITVVRGGVPWLLFVAAALGWLALMLAEGRERLSGWGRALGRRSARENDPLTHTPPEPLGVVGRRIGAAAVGLALVLPALLPWAGSSIFRSATGAGGTGGAGGAGPVTRLNPVAELGGFLTERTETTELTYTSTDLNPDYLRVITLDRFDGTAWQPALQQASGDVRNAPVSDATVIAGVSVQTKISIRALNQDWLPVTYPGGSVDGLTGRWSYDGTTGDVFRTGGSNTHGQSYTVLSRHLEPTADQLAAAVDAPIDILDRFTRLPTGIPASVLFLTDTVVAGKTTAYAKALALQQYFLNPANHFRYTTDPPAATGNALVAFLANRAGFCQQYAGAFAVMARQAGLPTRIEIGFTPGSSPDNTGQRNVTNHNAHAWPEVYFNGVGWVRFEPTVSNATGAVQPAWAEGPGGGTGLTGPGAGGSARGAGNRLSQDLSKDQKPVASTPVAKTAPQTAAPTSFPWALLIAVLAVVVLLLPGVARVARRRGRLRPLAPGGAQDPVRARARVVLAWDELADTARDLHDPWPAARTPRRTVDWLAASGIGPAAADAARRLAWSVERVRYAPAGVDLGGRSDPAADARVVAAAMESAATPRQRWRARMVPVSVLAAVSERLADVLDWTDMLGARSRDLFRRPLGRRGARAATTHTVG
jgi:transglutaminase-like putative cysteine protease